MLCLDRLAPNKTTLCVGCLEDLGLYWDFTILQFYILFGDVIPEFSFVK